MRTERLYISNRSCPEEDPVLGHWTIDVDVHHDLPPFTGYVGCSRPSLRAFQKAPSS